MSLPVPLAVRVQTSRADRYITRDLRDLSYRSVIPGGFASARLSLHRPLNLQPDEIDYYAAVTVYDRLTGEVEWDGWLEDPARQVSSDGQVWDLTAIGSAGHAYERKVPLIYIDRDLRALVRVDNASPNARDSIAEDPGGSGLQALVMQFPQGMTIGPGDRVVMHYNRLRWSGQKLGFVFWQEDAGVTDANQQTQVYARTDGSVASGDLIDSLAWNTNAIFGTGVVGTNWVNGRNTVEIRINRSAAAAAVPNPNFWASVYDLAVTAMRYGKNGVEITDPSAYNINVVPSEIVADLLGRLLLRYDGLNASIWPFHIGEPLYQLAYPDGVNPAGVFADLMKLDSTLYWAAWERNPANGRYRFEWVTWPTAIRYDASIVDGFDSPASAAGLYNRVIVRYRDNIGQIRTDEFSSTVPALDSGGVIRETVLDLGDEVATSAPQDAANAFFAEHSAPPNAGRLTVARPIYDAVRGRMIPPWKIRPGGLIRVRGVQPRADSLNPSGRDGATVFRVVATEFNAATASATLELDSTPLSVAASIAALSATAGRRRR